MSLLISSLGIGIKYELENIRIYEKYVPDNF